MKEDLRTEALKAIHEGQNIVFTFKWEARQFAQQNKLEIIYKLPSIEDDEHYQIKGYKSKLYWYVG